VLAGNWLMERDDGRRFGMSGAFNAKRQALDMAAIHEPP
jgi:hypothetical protein